MFVTKFSTDKSKRRTTARLRLTYEPFLVATFHIRNHFRKWFQPQDQKDPKTTRKGIALNLDQWVRMRKIVEVINNDHPVLAAAREYHIFPNLLSM